MQGLDLQKAEAETEEAESEPRPGTKSESEAEAETETTVSDNAADVFAVAAIRGSVDKQLQGWCVTLFSLFMQPFLAHSACYVANRSACKAAGIKLLFRMKKALQVESDFDDDRARWGYAALKFAERARWTLEGLDCPLAAARRSLLLLFKARSSPSDVAMIPPPANVLLREYLLSRESGETALGGSLSAAHVSVLVALQNLRNRVVCCRDQRQCVEEGGGGGGGGGRRGRGRGLHVVSIGGGPGNDLAGALLWLLAPENPETVTNREGRRQQRSVSVASAPSAGGEGAHESTSSSCHHNETDSCDAETQPDQSSSLNNSSSNNNSMSIDGPVYARKRKSIDNAMNLFRDGLNHSNLVDACASHCLQLTVADLYMGWKPLVEATSRVRAE